MQLTEVHEYIIELGPILNDEETGFFPKRGHLCTTKSRFCCNHRGEGERNTFKL